jgi:hypothetical protein
VFIKGLLTFVPRVFFREHRKRVLTKQLFTSVTRVFYPVNTGIGSSVLTKGLLTFVTRVFYPVNTGIGSSVLIKGLLTSVTSLQNLLLDLQMSVSSCSLQKD